MGRFTGRRGRVGLGGGWAEEEGVKGRGLNLCQNDVSETYTGRRRYVSSVERRDIDKSKHNRGRFHPSS